MIIVDGDTHVSANPGNGSIGIEDLINLLDENGVGMAICWPMVSYTRQVSDDNLAIAEGMGKHSKRIVGFGGLNPRLGLNEAKDELNGDVALSALF